MAFNSKTAAEAGRKSTRKDKPNKTTAQVRALVMDLIDDNIEQIQQDIAALDPKDRVNIWLKLLEFYLPKPREVEPMTTYQPKEPAVIVFSDTRS